MVDQGRVGDVDLFFGRNIDHGHDHREFGNITAKVGCHRDDGAFAVTGEHDLGGVVEEVGIRLGDIEAAKGRSRRCEGEAERGQRQGCG